MIRASCGVLALLALVSVGCSDDPPSEPSTAIIVEVDSDLDVPDELDEIRVSATAGSSESDAGDQMASGSLEDRGLELPVRVVLVPARGATTVRILAEGYLNGVRVRVQAIRTKFVANEVVTRHMDLAEACDIECPAGQTCVAAHGNARCQSEVIDLDDLDGGENVGDGGDRDSGLDGGGDAGDAGACVPDDETCNGRDDDCDDHIDEGTTVCPQDLPFATSVCRSKPDGGASCEFGECSGAHLRCPGDVGCETAMSGTNCGECGNECVASVCQPNSDSEFECRNGGCVPATLSICDNTCVDQDTSLDHCGACHDPDNGEYHRCDTDVARAAPTCDDGHCALNCEDGYKSCDDEDPAPGSDEYLNGCETHTDEDPNNCGTCNNVCQTAGPHTLAYCEAGICKTRCETNWIECNGAIPGCEANATVDGNCGGCGVTCSALSDCCGNPPACGLLGTVCSSD